MSFGEFFLQSDNGKKINLNFKGKLYRADFEGNKKLLKIFDYFDTDHSGIIESTTEQFGKRSELANLFEHIKEAASLRQGGKNDVLDTQEAFSLTNFIKDLKEITPSELFEFLQIAVEKKNEVVKEDIKTSADGTKTITNTLKSGTVETFVYEPDGSLKFKVTETPIREDYSEASKAVIGDNEYYQKPLDNKKRGDLKLPRGVNEAIIELTEDSIKYYREKYNKDVASAYYLDGVMELRDVNNNPVMQISIEISPKTEEELRAFIGKYLKESSQRILEYAKTLGGIDKLAVDLHDISIDKNKLALAVLNPALLLTTIDTNGLEKLEGYLNQLEENVKNGELLEKGATTKGAFDSRFERITGKEDVNFLQIERFRQTTVKYQNVQALNQRTTLLENGLKEIKQLYQNYRAQREGVPNASKLNSNFDGKIFEVLTQFFNGDKDVARALIQTISKDIKSKDDLYNKFTKVLNKIKQTAEEEKTRLLDGESAEDLKTRYEKEYKDMYGQDAVFKAEDLITGGKEWGGMIQIGIMTVVQMLLAATTMGSGNAALMALQSNSLVRFLTAVGTDYALSLANILTSERGFTEEAREELHQRTLGTGQFIGFGMIGANPLARTVGKFVSNLFAKESASLLEGAFAQEIKAGANGITRTTSGALTKTTLSGEAAFEWLMVNSSKFITEVGAFSGFELVTSNEDFKNVIEGQAGMLSKLKVMNSALQVLLGSFVKNQALRGQAKLTVKEYNQILKDMEIGNAKLIENKRPGGCSYTLEINGESTTFKDIKELQANFMAIIAESFIKTREIPEEIRTLPDEQLLADFSKLIQRNDKLSEKENQQVVDMYKELLNRGMSIDESSISKTPSPEKVIDEENPVLTNMDMKLSSLEESKVETTPNATAQKPFGNKATQRKTEQSTHVLVDVAEENQALFVSLQAKYKFSNNDMKILEGFEPEDINQILENKNLENPLFINQVGAHRSALFVNEVMKLTQKYPDVPKDTIIGLVKNFPIQIIETDNGLRIRNTMDNVIALASKFPNLKVNILDYLGNKFPDDKQRFTYNRSLEDFDSNGEYNVYRILSNPNFEKIAKTTGVWNALTNGSQNLSKRTGIGEMSHGVTPESIKEKGLKTKTWEEKSKELEIERQKRVAALDKMTMPENMSKAAIEIEEKITKLNIQNKEEISALQQLLLNESLPQNEKLYLETLINNRINPPTIENCTHEQIAAEVTLIRRHYNNIKNDLITDMENTELLDIGEKSGRLKSDTSTYDKIFNYLKDKTVEKTKNSKEPRTQDADLMEALTDIRDQYGNRSVIKAGNYTIYPEVARILVTANTAKTPEARRKILIQAARKAAEFQSEKLLNSLKEQIIKQVQSPDGLKSIRINNYVSENGIPILSESQLWDLKKFAEEVGVEDIDIKLLDPSEDVFSKEGIGNKKYKHTTKVQNGYVAFQMNFETKNGDKMEFQCRDIFTNDFAEAEHFIYDTLTGKDIIGRHPETRDLFNQLLEVLDENNLDPKVLDLYRKTYITDYYTYCRAKSVGIDLGEPLLSDYTKKIGQKLGIPDLKLDERLDARNLMLLHNLADKVKTGQISKTKAMELYRQGIEFNTQIENNPSLRESFAITGKESDIEIAGVRIATKKAIEGLNYDLQHQILKQTNSENAKDVTNLLNILTKNKNFDSDIVNKYLSDLFYMKDFSLNLKKNVKLVSAIQEYLNNNFELSTKELTEILDIYNPMDKYIEMLESGYSYAQTKALNKTYSNSIKNSMQLIFTMQNEQAKLGNQISVEGLENISEKHAQFVAGVMNLHPTEPQEVINIIKELLPKISEFDVDKILSRLQEVKPNEILNKLIFIKNDSKNMKRVDAAYTLTKDRYCRKENGEYDPVKIDLLNKIAFEINKEKQAQSEKGFFTLSNTDLSTIVDFLAKNGKFNEQGIEYACRVINDTESRLVERIMNFMSYEEYIDFCKKHPKDLDLLENMSFSENAKYDPEEVKFMFEVKNEILSNDKYASFSLRDVSMADFIYKNPIFKNNSDIEDIAELIDGHNASIKDLLELEKLITDKNIKCQNIMSLALLIETKSNKIPQILSLIQSSEYQNKAISVDVEQNTIYIMNYVKTKKSIGTETLQKEKRIKTGIIYNLDTLTPISKQESKTKSLSVNTNFDIGHNGEIELSIERQTKEHHVSSNTIVDSTVKGNSLSIAMRLKEHTVQHLGENDELLFNEIWKASKIKKNAFDIYYEYPDGKKELISVVEKTPAGEVVIEKTFKSPDGSKTNYVCIEGDGWNLRNYELKDENGQVILRRNQRTKYIDENHYKTTTDDRSYDVAFEDNIFHVTDKNGTTLDIKLDDIVKGGAYTKKYFADILKQIPVEDLIILKELGIKLQYSATYIGNAEYNPNNTIKFGPSIKNIDKVFVFLHELNHAKDSRLIDAAYRKLNIEDKAWYLYSDKKYKALREEELKNLREKEPAIYQLYLSYFIDKTSKDPKRPFEEMVAELGAIQNADQSSSLSYRIQFLQKYFPKTNAYLTGRVSELQTKLVENAFENDGLKSSKNKPQINRPYNETVPMKEQYPEMYERIKAKFENAKTDMTYSIDRLLKCYAHDKEMFEYLFFELEFDSITIGRMASLIAHGHKDAYLKMRDSGLFELIKEGKIDKSILSNVKDNSYLSDALLGDIAKKRNGEGAVVTLPNDTKLTDINKFSQSGEVVEINGKLYANNNGKAIEIKLSKSAFEKLFPLINRFSASQGKIGDCWLISTLSGLMYSTEGRIKLFQLFSQEGNDILVQFPDSKQIIRFENGEPANVDNTSSNCKGFTLIEQAFAIERHNKYKVGQRDTNAKLLEQNPKWLWSNIDGGLNEYALYKILGGSDGLFSTFAQKDFWKVIATTVKRDLFVSDETKNRRTHQELIDFIKKYANDNTKIFYIGTKSIDNTGEEHIINKEYDLFSGHAYSVKGYNARTGMVKITNPWYCEVVTEVPLDYLLDQIQYWGCQNLDGTHVV